jgi:hypothetical protein
MTGQLLFRMVFGILSALIAIWVALQAIGLWIDKKLARAIGASLIALAVLAGATEILCGRVSGDFWTGLIGLPFLLIVLFQFGCAINRSLRK